MIIFTGHKVHLLTIDPNFQRDIQRDGSRWEAIKSHLRDMTPKTGWLMTGSL